MISSLFKYAPVQVFSSLCLFALIAVQTHFLSIEDYGILAIIMVFIEGVRAISSQWLIVTLLRYYPASDITEKANLVSTTSVMTLLLAIPALITIFIALYVYEIFTVNILCSSSLLLLMKVAYMYRVELCRLNEDIDKYRKGVLVNSISSIVCSFLILYIWPSITSAIFSLALSNLFALFFLKNELKTNFEIKTFKVIISYGLPIMISGGIIAIGSRLDRLFIGKFIGLEETGIYSAFSNTLMGIISLVFMVISVPLYPELTKITNNKSELINKHQHYLDVLVAITLPSLLGICFIAEPLIKVFLSQEYLNQGVELFWILAVSVYVLNLKIHYIDHGLQFLNKTKYFPFVAFVSILVNITLLSLTLRTLGVYGAAWIILISNTIGLILAMFIALYFGYRYRFGLNIAKVMLSCGLMLVALLLKEAFFQNLEPWIDIIISVCLGFLVYSISMFILNALKIKDFLTRIMVMR
ncbi:oligosaccharide flippase family protein [Vibrio cholerae]|nr:oligosaccharide flippase family protein [Vibrio cholerae]